MRERDLIQTIADKARTFHPLLQKGIGDDCAIFRSSPGDDWLVTTDMLVEGVHFDPSFHSPYLLGRKSLAVNISDIAAMGGTPQFVLLSLALPTTCPESWTKEYMAGFFSLLHQFGCVLIGGDTVTSEKISLSVTVLGTVAAGGALGRDGAGEGDGVYVSGDLGSAAAGLHLLQHEKQENPKLEAGAYPRLIQRHLDPTPRVQLGQKLRESGMVTAMQDVSDGIATDLSHICTASKVAAVIEARALPADEQLVELCARLQLDPASFQIRGGEDYELLFTVRKGHELQLSETILASCGMKIIRIGTITAGEGVTMLSHSGAETPITYQGYEHLG